MKIKTVNGNRKLCSSCNGEDFKPLDDNRFECRTCGEEMTTANPTQKGE